MSERKALILFIVGVLGAGMLIGAVSAPDGWYASLAKPSFNPPNWVFAPAWTILYVLVAIAGWRIWRLPERGAAMGAWVAQMAFNFAWSPAFFALHQIGLALAVALLMLASILAFIVAAWPRDRVAALLFVPYAAWVALASLLNAAIWRLN